MIDDSARAGKARLLRLKLGKPDVMDVFATLGHMHKQGRHLTVTKNDAVVFEQEWDFDNQPITPVDLTVAKEDVLGSSARTTTR